MSDAQPGLRQGRLDQPAAALAKGAPRHCTAQDGETTKVSRLSSMLPRVAELIIREAPVKLNLRFEELASVMSGKFSTDRGQPCTMAQLMLAHRKVS